MDFRIHGGLGARSERARPHLAAGIQLFSSAGGGNFSRCWLATQRGNRASHVKATARLDELLP